METILWVLNLADGSHSLLDIAERSGIPFALVADAADVLAAHGLLVTRRLAGEGPRHRASRLHRVGSGTTPCGRRPRRRRARHGLLRGVRLRRTSRSSVASAGPARCAPRRPGRVRRRRAPRCALERPTRRPGCGMDVRDQPRRHACSRPCGARGRSTTLRVRLVVCDVRRFGNRRPTRRRGASATADAVRGVEGARRGGPLGSGR